MIAKKDWELIKAIKNHKCCGENGGSSDGSESSSNEVTANCECPAPLVVKGGLQEDDGDYYFYPDDNQPTFSEAVAAFNSGVQIIFDINPNPNLPMPEGAYFRSIALECVSDYEGFKQFFFFSGGAPTFWNDTDEGGEPTIEPIPIS